MPTPDSALSPSLFHLDPHQAEPIYRQLMAQVRRLIAAGQLAAGDELPSVRALAAAHAINPMTISKAYSLLEAEGLLQRNRGAAMSVAAAATQHPHSNDERLALLQPALARVVSEAQQLGLEPDAVLQALAAQLQHTTPPEENSNEQAD
ncbi:GntR family transcriptional regulator [Uliginosibacterium sediminicola]|uniref:GntR family transcriptional regulator n=1 Tax=Uliginosibacterium sediminicola TaxID=2024550 RepID=A0ABU9YZ67_9RHOO